jgi:hypothetical protein
MKNCGEGLTTLLEQTRPLKQQLQSHPLYSSITTIADVRRFMETHVFAVWDFMSLLKALQRGITCVAVPWIPTEHPAARLINEIVRDEESDLGRSGEPVSHFELYRSAMMECGSDTSCIDRFLKLLGRGCPVTLALEIAGVPAGACEFVKATFRVISTGQLHQIAAAFAFGREDLIPEMFSAIIHEMKHDIPGLETFHYYLDRHIQLDGDEHAPHAHNMVSELCGTDPARWQEAISAANEALLARIHLWDSLVAGGLLAVAETFKPESESSAKMFLM